jgi:hypothetical protein
MSRYTQRYIEELKELKYMLRAGLVFSDEQKEEIVIICNLIIKQIKQEARQ